MNRRSMLKTAIGACAAMLLPWRKAKASSWAYPVTWRLGMYRQGCAAKQFNRIKRILKEREPKPSGLQKLFDIGDVVTYEVSVSRVVWTNWTAVLFVNRSAISEAVVSIDDSVAGSMTNQELFDQLMQGFLWALKKNKPIHIEGKSEITLEGCRSSRRRLIDVPGESGCM